MRKVCALDGQSYLGMQDNDQIGKRFKKILDKMIKRDGIERTQLLGKNIQRSLKDKRVLLAYSGVMKLGMNKKTAGKYLNVTNGSICKMLTSKKVLLEKYEDNEIEEMMRT